MRYIFIFLTFFIVLASSCHKKEAVKNHEDYILKGDTLFLPEGSNIKNKIQLSSVKEKLFRLEINTVGTVRTIPNTYAQITPPFSGRILKSFIKLGQTVQPGSPIFEMSSSDYSDALKNYFDTKQEFKQAELNLKRQQNLLKFEVGIQQDLEQAQTNFEVSKTAFSNAKAALRIFNSNPEASRLGEGLIIRSPIKGTVVENNIVIGQYLREDSGAMAVVAELSKVWIAGQIKEKDIHNIRELGEVQVQIAALPDETIKGKIYHIKELVDETTRSVEVLIACDNKDRNLRPGMFVTVKFIDTPEASILIPEKSVLQFNDNAFVFVQTKKDHYIKKQIEVGSTYDGQILINSGVQNGDIIIRDGGIYLMAAK